ncbi:MAG: methionyl-tRNA formyltransferase [Chloroflexota bacterium]
MIRKAIRVVFFGTPEYAVPTLVALTEHPWFSVTLVVTQPDRPAGRGHRPQPSPVKVEALRRGLPIYQPATLRRVSDREPLISADADVFVVAAFGLIFGKRTLALPRFGSLNLHASLLPKYRGASPVAAAILAGDQETGVSLMLMDEGLDTGPVVATAAVSIDPADTTESLTGKLAEAGALLAVEAIPRFVTGELPAIPQPEFGASRVRPLTKADGWLRWERPASELERRVRAMWPWPRAWTTVAGEPLQIHRATVLDHGSHPPGRIAVAKREVWVACGHGALRLDIVQPAGGKPMPGPAWVTGRRFESGIILGQEGDPGLVPPLVVPVIVDGESRP